MIFPVGDNQVKGGSLPIFTYAIIVINILIFFFQSTLAQNDLFSFYDQYAVQPVEILQSRELYTLFTSMFLHGGWLHLIGNMLFLWVFADNIEATVGNLNFLLFFFLGGIIAAFAHILLNSGSEIFTVGASGAISAALGAYLIMFPKSKIKVWVIFLFGYIEVSATLFLGFWILQQMISGFGSLSGAGTGVAWWAHIGGFFFGVIYGLLNLKKASKVKLAP